MGGKGGSGNSSDVVYVVLERGVAVDLLNALYIALGIAPEGEKAGGPAAKGVGGGKSIEVVMGAKVGGSKGGGGQVGGGETGGKGK